jgi:hypothetical protein
MDGLYAEELDVCVTRLFGVVAFLGAAHTEAVLMGVALFYHAFTFLIMFSCRRATQHQDMEGCVEGFVGRVSRAAQRAQSCQGAQAPAAHGMRQDKTCIR